MGDTGAAAEPGSRHDDRERAELRFGAFRFEPRGQELLRDGRRVDLPPQPAALLGLLLEHRGRLVTRQQIRERIWGETVVEHEQRIHSLIRDLRRALGDSPATPRYIETVPKKGYRFIESVERWRPGGSGPGGRRLRVAAPLAAAAVAAGLLAISMLWRPAGSDPGALAGVPRALMLVRPVQPIGPDPDHVAAGLWEELLVASGRIAPDALGVIARTTALKLESEAGPDIAKVDGIDYVLETILRRDEDRVRVTATLSRPDAPEPVWSAPYDGEIGDLLGVQRDIAEGIARALRLEIVVADDARAGVPEIAPDAYSAYLTGRHLLALGTDSELRRAVDAFERSLAIDHRFAAAHVGLARALDALSEQRDRARAAVDEALRLDPSLGEAHFVDGQIRLYREWDWAAAAPAFEAAVALEPGSAETRLGYAELMVSTGRFTDAVAQARRARALDPLSGGIRGRLGWLYLRAREPELAIEECLRARDVVPETFYDDLITHDCLVLGYRQLGDTRNAVAFATGVMRLFGQGLDDGGTIPGSPANVASEHSTAAPVPPDEIQLDRYWRWRIAEMSQFPGAIIDVALSQVALGDRDGAMESLWTAFERRARALVFLATDPGFDPLRDDPDFVELNRRIGNPLASDRR